MTHTYSFTGIIVGSACMALVAISPASAACTAQEYMQKLQATQTEMAAFQQKDPERFQKAMIEMRARAEELTKSLQDGKTPPDYDKMCRFLDDLHNQMRQ